jgi:glycosyltransferase involved in cell wall biosynthesis
MTELKETKTKFAILSHSLPPSSTGQAIMLYRLVEGIPAENFCLLSKENYSSRISGFENHDRIPARYYWIGSEQANHLSKIRFMAVIQNIFHGLLTFVGRVRQICIIMRDEKTQVLIACTGAILDILVGFFATKIVGNKFIAYIFDDYVYQWLTGLRRRVLKILTPYILRNSSATIVPNEFLQEEYKTRYGITPFVIHNPVESIPEETIMDWPLIAGKIRIVFTGSIYQAHFDAFVLLIKAITILNRGDIEFQIYTSQTMAELSEQGVQAPFIKILPTISPSEISKIQRQADILFLPLAFNSPYPEVIRTSAPGKMGEYLASGRPILALAPEGSFIDWYFTKYQTGMVINRPDPELLAKAIIQIIDQPLARKNWGQKAISRARIDFSKEEAQLRFLNLLENVNRLE